MGEAKRKGAHGGAYAGLRAAQEFFRRYLEADDDADVTFRDAEMSDGSIVVACAVGGYVAALPTPVLRVLADVAEETLRKFPGEPSAACLPDLIMTLRESADRVEAIYGVEVCRRAPGGAGEGVGDGA